MAKTNFYLRDAKSTQPTPILLYVSFSGERVKLPTNETILPEFWNAKEQRPRQTAKFPTYPEFRTRLNNLTQLVTDLIRTYQNDHHEKTPTVKTLKELWGKATQKEQTPEPAQENMKVVAFMEWFVNESKKRVNERTGKTLSDATIIVYNQILNKVKDFITTNRNYKNLDFEGIDAGFYTDFVDYLTTKKKLSVNTVGKTIRTFKVFLNNATEEGINTNLYFKRKNFKAVQENTSSIYLNEDELKSLYSFDFSATPALDRARDLFLIGCWTGLRFSDFSQIRHENITEDETGKYIKLETQKTGEFVEIPLHDTILSIMQKYEGKYSNNLPPSLTNQPLNRYLKEIGSAVGFDALETIIFTKGGKRITKQLPKYKLLVTHTARRSFATNLYLLGVPSITIMAITTHRTEKSFMKYIKVSKREHAQKIREIWNSQREQPINNILKLVI